MRVLGIDPGIRATGFGIIDSNINKLSLVACGTVNPKVSESLPLRLNHLFEEIDSIINKFSPDVFSIEDMFYSKNVKTAMHNVTSIIPLYVAAAGNNPRIFPNKIKKNNVNIYGKYLS